MRPRAVALGVTLVVALHGCASKYPAAPLSSARQTSEKTPTAEGGLAERDRNDCLARAQSSMGRDFVVDSRSRRLVTVPDASTLANYATETELTVLNAGLIDYLLFSCLYLRGYRLFHGFAFVQPPGHGWEEASLDDPEEFSVGLTRFVSKNPPHVALAMIRIKKLRWPVARNELVRHAAAEDLRREWAIPRYSLLTFDTSETTWLNAECVRYSITASDRGVPGFPGAVFTVQVRGLRCVHPDLPTLQPRQVVDISYGERFLGGQGGEAVRGGARRFLDSLIFTRVHPTSYVISAFGRYAELLRELNRDAEAAELQVLTRKLVEAEQTDRVEVGFNPATILREYAALLRKQNREEGAREAEALAAEYLRGNFAHYLRRNVRPPQGLIQDVKQ